MAFLTPHLAVIESLYNYISSKGELIPSNPFVDFLYFAQAAVYKASVVLGLKCPSDAWINFMSLPCSRGCVAKECLKVCKEAFLEILAACNKLSKVFCELLSEYRVGPERLDHLTLWTTNFQKWVYEQSLDLINKILPEQPYENDYTLKYRLLDLDALKNKQLPEAALAVAE